MYSRILVAIDGSPVSELALRHAVRIAAELKAKLCIVHAVDEVNVVNWDSEFGDPAAVWDAAAERGRRLLDRAAATAREACAVETRLVEINLAGTRVAEVIKGEADAWSADLVVVGTHGRRGLSHLFLGSVAEGIARIANQPVLLVRGA